MKNLFFFFFYLLDNMHFIKPSKCWTHEWTIKRLKFGRAKCTPDKLSPEEMSTKPNVAGRSVEEGSVAGWKVAGQTYQHFCSRGVNVTEHWSVWVKITSTRFYEWLESVRWPMSQKLYCKPRHMSLMLYCSIHRVFRILRRFVIKFTFCLCV